MMLIFSFFIISKYLLLTTPISIKPKTWDVPLEPFNHIDLHSLSLPKMLKSLVYSPIFRRIVIVGPEKNVKKRECCLTEIATNNT